MHTVQYSETLIRRAVTRAIVRLLGPLFFVAIAIVTAATVFEVAQGDRGWLVGVGGTVVFLGILIPIAAIRSHVKVALEKLSGMEHGRGQVELSGGQLHLASRLGTMSLPLERVTSIWRYPEYWVLLSGRSILMTLPLEGLSGEILTEWLAQFRSAGATVA